MYLNALNRTEVDEIFGGEEVEAGDSQGLMNEKQQLDEIRRLSNVIQALENLVVQCADIEEFLGLEKLAKSHLFIFREKLKKMFHSY